MDLLKKELERKKKSVAKAKASAGGRKFFRAADLRKQMEEQEQAEDVDTNRKRKVPGSSVKDTVDNKEDTSVDQHQNHNNKNANKKAKHIETGEAKENTDKNEENDTPTVLASPEEVTRRLRNIGHPIKLFGETTTDRLQRLRKALDELKNVQAGLSEMEEFRLGRGHGIRNPFLMKDDEKESEAGVAAAVKQGGDGKDHSKSNNDDNKAEQKKDDQEDENDAHKRVYKYFKNLLNQWEDDLALRPDTVKKSVAGRNETKTLKQCKDYIRSLFKLCKSRRIDESLLAQLHKIVLFCEEEEFVKAHDTYMDVAIGRAAWPIGVTMVGIHARTGRAKIESSNVAHVMNSELQRKYLTSVKRLMSYAQKTSNADPSKKVVN